MAELEVALLGPVEVRRDGIVQRLGPRERALVALLALQPRRVVSPVTLISGVWGEEPPATAANTVQVHMSRIRRALGRDAVRGELSGALVKLAHAEREERATKGPGSHT